MNRLLRLRPVLIFMLFYLVAFTTPQPSFCDVTKFSFTGNLSDGSIFRVIDGATFEYPQFHAGQSVTGFLYWNSEATPMWVGRYNVGPAQWAEIYVGDIFFNLNGGYFDVSLINGIDQDSLSYLAPGTRLFQYKGDSLYCLDLLDMSLVGNSNIIDDISIYPSHLDLSLFDSGVIDFVINRAINFDDYFGRIEINITQITAFPMLYADFNASGLYQYNDTTWSQVTLNSPEAMVVSGSTLYGDFGAAGIWMRNGTTWSQTTPSNPQMMSASSSTLYGAFSEAGIWQYNGTTWSQTTPNSPEAMAVSGSNLYGDFGSYGIWMHNGTTWSQTTPSDPQMMTTSDLALYVAFSGAGIWRWNGSYWSRITQSNPEAMVASSSILYGDFGSYGIWTFDGNGLDWSQLIPLNPEQMVSSANDLYVDFGSAGLWKYDGTSWRQVTPNNPTSMVVGY